MKQQKPTEAQTETESKNKQQEPIKRNQKKLNL